MKFARNAKVYSACFAFCGVFSENIREIPAKCEIRKVYSWPKNLGKLGLILRKL